MKPTGIVRKLDELGRLCIPKEIRKVFGWNDGDSMEIYVEGNSIIIKKYQPGCIFCGSMDNVVKFNGKRICKECLNGIKNI